MKNKDIIIGVDFSDSSKAALKEAGHIASLRQGWLNIVHVIDIEFFEREIDEKFLTVDQLTRQAEKALKDFALKALDRPPSLRFFVFVGHPFEELLTQTKTLKCDLLVLGSYGNSGKSDRTGTTATRFVRKAPIPVLLVREKQRSPFKDIVVCYDFSETAKRALDYAVEEAVIHGARLHVLHIHVTYPHPYVYPHAETLTLPPQYYADYLPKLELKLEKILAPVQKAHPEIETKAVVIKSSGAAPEIYDYVKKTKADLTVLGTRGRTGFRRLLLGTTAEKLVHKCPSSVLAIKPADFKA